MIVGRLIMTQERDGRMWANVVGECSCGQPIKHGSFADDPCPEGKCELVCAACGRHYVFDLIAKEVR